MNEPNLNGGQNVNIQDRPDVIEDSRFYENVDDSRFDESKLDDSRFDNFSQRDNCSEIGGKDHEIQEKKGMPSKIPEFREGKPSVLHITRRKTMCSELENDNLDTPSPKTLSFGESPQYEESEIPQLDMAENSQDKKQKLMIPNPEKHQRLENIAATLPKNPELPEPNVQLHPIMDTFIHGSAIRKKK